MNFDYEIKTSVILNKMFVTLLKMFYYIAVVMSVLVSFYYVELYNKLLKEVVNINKKLNKLSKK